MIEALINNVKSIDFDLIVAKALPKYEDEMVALQKRRMSKGKAIDGTSFKNPYSDPYKKKRQKSGLQTKVKDYNFSGDHYNGMFADVGRSFTKMGSNDWKELILEWMEGDKRFYGLSEEDRITLLDMGLQLDIVGEFNNTVFV